MRSLHIQGLVVKAWSMDFLFLFHSYLLALFRPITSYYQVAEQERDYICALPKDNGMHQCDNLPHSRYNGEAPINTARWIII